MAHSDFTYNNLFHRNCERFYLDSSTADVFFVCVNDYDQFERIPAHKMLLSIGSPVFEAMFYGPIKENNEISIVDASTKVFKLFLQLLYLNKVTLGSDAEDLSDVMYLCKKYQLNDCLKVCVAALKDTLTNENMCWGYRIANLMEQEELGKFCEQKIQENASEILKSESFLECDRTVFGKMLQLVHFNCDALVIVDASLEWAKAGCKRKGLIDNIRNIREHFGDLDREIPFDELTCTQFRRLRDMFEEDFRQRPAVSLKEVECYIDWFSYNLSSVSIGFNMTENQWITKIYFGNSFEKLGKDADKLTFVIKGENTDTWLASGYVDIDSRCLTLSKPLPLIEHCLYSITFTKTSQEAWCWMSREEEKDLINGFKDGEGMIRHCIFQL